jgi:short-subunit dehydrogenase
VSCASIAEKDRYQASNQSQSVLSRSVIKIFLPVWEVMSLTLVTGCDTATARELASRGFHVLAGYGAYAGSKFALEAMSDALRREVAPLGVQVIVVEPGGVKTEMSGRGIATAHRLAERMTVEQHERYGPMMQALVSHTQAFTEAGVTAERAARIIARAVTDRHPRIRYTIGRDAAIMTRLSRILPDRLLDRFVAANLRPHYPANPRLAPSR